MENIHSQRVEEVRRLMAESGWDAVVITSSDPHASEYLAPRWQSVTWVSGFTGEAADLVITQDHAGLWTDSRYFIQAEEQLEGSGIVLHKTRMPDSVDIPHWLAGKAAGWRRNGERAATVALDGRSVSAAFVSDIVKISGCKVVDVPDMIDRVRVYRPEVPENPIITLDEEEIGESRFDKLVWLRKFLLARGCDAVLVSALDEIAWLLNVRGSDIEYNPYVFSYLYVSFDRALWFVRKGETSQGNEEAFEELAGDGIEILGYEDVFSELYELREEGDKRLFVDSTTLNYSLYNTVCEVFEDGGAEGVVSGVVEGTSPVQLRKAVKNEREIEALHEAHLEDGVAMEKFLKWLEDEVASGAEVTEWDASQKLTSLRSEIVGFRGNSFENISAYGAHAALPHYSTPCEGSARIEPHGLYLVDSGGQYFFGTTDITRTVPMGECTALEREDYTLVLKGMIQLATAVFPRGTAGCQLDVLARIALWRSRRDFGHGTGHGVGFFLGVHEGPQSIRQNLNPQPLVPGMVTSDEPGIYREGMHGVRHENLVLCVEAGRSEFGDWLAFETLTLCHIDTSAIVPELMTADELCWLNDYNERVFLSLSPRLSASEAAWLRRKTLPVG